MVSFMAGLLAGLLGAWHGADPTLVKTRSGIIRGGYLNNSNQLFFRGVPYAAPPINELRWKPPKAARPWEGVRNAIAFAPDCAQLGPAWKSLKGGVHPTPGGRTTTSEDCLYTNIYVPINNRTATDPTKKYPVMLYFPAGQYMWGGGNDQESNSKPVLDWADVIVVTLGYRLSIFGFLCLEEFKNSTSDGSQCNFGLLDQIAAVEWLQANIEAFGGDPNNIVLWGESAGGSAVTTLLVVKRLKNRFHKAIIESGAFNPWAYRPLRDARVDSTLIARSLGCNASAAGTSLPALRGPSTAPEAVRACMLKQSTWAMLSHSDDGGGSYLNDNAHTLPYGDGIDTCLWGPTVDGMLLQAPPHELLAQGKAARVPLLLGTNRDEGATFVMNQSGLRQRGTLIFNESWPIYSMLNKQVNESGLQQWAGQVFGREVEQELMDLYSHADTVGSVTEQEQARTQAQERTTSEYSSAAWGKGVQLTIQRCTNVGRIGTGQRWLLNNVQFNGSTVGVGNGSSARLSGSICTNSTFQEKSLGAAAETRLCLSAHSSKPTSPSDPPVTLSPALKPSDARKRHPAQEWTWWGSPHGSSGSGSSSGRARGRGHSRGSSNACQTENGWDYGGGDVGGAGGVASAAECCAMCRNTTGCEYFSYGPPVQFCFMKSLEISNRKPNAHRVSGSIGGPVPPFLTSGELASTLGRGRCLGSDIKLHNCSAIRAKPMGWVYDSASMRLALTDKGGQSNLCLTAMRHQPPPMPSKAWWSAEHIVGDFLLSCSARRAARLWASERIDSRSRSEDKVKGIVQQTQTQAQTQLPPVFLYYFNHTPAYSINEGNTTLLGAFHGAEVPFVFYDAFELKGAGEVSLSQSMVWFWTNFAWSGNPNYRTPANSTAKSGNVPKLVPALPDWSEYTPENDIAIVFGMKPAPFPVNATPDVNVVSGLKHHECGFWDEYEKNSSSGDNRV